MLDFFRKKGLTSVIYGIIIVGMILVFVLGFSPSAGKKLGSVSEACAARVRGSCIEPKAHRAAYRLIFSRGTGSMKQATASRIVLEGLIERELLVTEAQRLGLTVNEEEITDSIFHGNALFSMPGDNAQVQRSMGIDEGRVNVGFKDPKTKQFDMKTYERLARQISRSPTEFRDWQSRELLAAKMRDLIRAPVRVADDEAIDRFMTERTTSTVNFVVVRRSWVEKYALAADARDIDVWQKDKINLAQIKVPVRHVLVKYPADPQAKEATKAKAQGLFDRIKKGEDFAKIAKEFSEDPGSKDKGGQYPGEMVEKFVEPFRKAVESVKPGELVPNLVETDFGYHIIKRDEATKDDILKAYKQSKSLDLSKAIATKTANDIKSGKPGEEAVKAAIAQYGTIKPAPRAADLKKAAPGRPGDGGADAGNAAADDAGSAGLAGPEYTADSDPERPQFLTSSAFNRGGDPIPAISGEASSAVTAFAFSAKPGDVVPEPIRTDDGFLVVTLKEQKPATKEEFEKERDPYMQTLLGAKQAEALGNYTRRLRDAAKAEIKIDENNVMGAKSDAGAARNDEEDEGP